MNRLPLPTLRVDPGRELVFNFAGRRMSGLAGDSIATAMYSAGVRIFSRSIKYHRPRGLYSLDGESSNCLMEVDGLPNVRAETKLLAAGIKVRAQNVLGTPERDLYSLVGIFDRLMPAGFYYRRFHKPYGLWPFFMRYIRKMAGVGRLNESWTPGRAAELFLNADVGVVGGGPAGLSAALAAARAGLRVALFEARPALGGFYNWRVREDQAGLPLYKRAAELAEEALSAENIRVFTSTPVTGLWGDNQITAVQSGGEGDSFDERYIEVRAGSVVVASGCGERPLIFKNNDRPGVMQPSCAWRLARQYGLLPGRRAVMAVGDDLGLEAAADLADLGVEIAAVADLRTGIEGPAVQSLADRKIRYLPGWTALKVEGYGRVDRVVLTNARGAGRETVVCDLLAASAGGSPVIGPLSVAGAELVHDEHTNYFLPKKLPPRVHAAGRLLGLGDPEAIEASGELAGLAAAVEQGADLGHEIQAARERSDSLPGPDRGCSPVTAPLEDRGAKAFVCFDEDATYEHIRQSAESGFDMPELAKRWSAAGTGPGQGGIPGHNLPLVLADIIKEEGNTPLPTTIRPPLVPVLFNTLAGGGHQIFKLTPFYRQQEKSGGVFRRAGVWKRAGHFGDDSSARAEIEAVRTNVGVIDVSTLGKFRIFGPDAVKALDRVYIGDMETIPEGRLKYSAMLNDDGCLMDDGVITKTGENDYYLTTSSSRAGQTAEWITYHAKEEKWDFHLVNLTDTLCAVNVAGPRSREVVAKLTRADISNESFPYLGYREMELAGGIPARVMRVGFVGELSYEIHAPASMAAALWAGIMEAGREFGLGPFGLEAQNVLRLEKGHIIIGQESEIRTTLHDLGLTWLWARNKAESKKVGSPALRFTENQTGRLKLVGIEMEAGSPVPGDGSLIVDDQIRGHVCTVRFSQTLGRTIGLALVQDHLSQEGTRLFVFTEKSDDERLGAVVTGTPFYDPEGKRLKS